MELSSLHKDPTLLIALELSPKDLLNLCRTSTRFNDLICSNDTFWRMKLVKDFNFNDFQNTQVKGTSAEQIYTKIVNNQKICNSSYYLTAPIRDYYVIFDLVNAVINKYAIYHLFAHKIIYDDSGIMMSRGTLEYFNLPVEGESYQAFVNAYKNLSKEKAKQELLEMLSSVTDEDVKKGFNLPVNIIRNILDGFISGRIPLDIKWKDVCKYVTI